jgi:mannitol/fructose-specific phosphotransferase system IIA component (Ntr-type)
VSEQLLFIGTSAEGFQVSGTSAPVHVLLVLLNPADYNATQHLHTLAALARLVRSDETVERLRAATSREALHETLSTIPAPA